MKSHEKPNFQKLFQMVSTMFLRTLRVSGHLETIPTMLNISRNSCKTVAGLTTTLTQLRLRSQNHEESRKTMKFPTFQKSPQISSRTFLCIFPRCPRPETSCSMLKHVWDLDKKPVDFGMDTLLDSIPVLGLKSLGGGATWNFYKGKHTLKCLFHFWTFQTILLFFVFS